MTICYQALYQYDPENASIYLPTLIGFPEHEISFLTLKINIKQMLKYLVSSQERSMLWEKVLCIMPKINIPATLVKLASLGICFHPPEFEYDSFANQIPVVYGKSAGWNEFPTDYVDSDRLHELFEQQYPEDTEMRYYELVHNLVGIHEEMAPQEVQLMEAYLM